MSDTPHISTHVPLLVDIPKEEVDQSEDHRRADITPPNIWPRAVGVVRKSDGKRAAVHVLDLNTRQFRAYYPEEQRFGDRTEWHPFDAWNVDVTFSPAELERQAAATKLSAELDALNGAELKLFQAFCMDDDPRKALAKLDAMRDSGLGMFRPKADVPSTATTDTKGNKK